MIISKVKKDNIKTKAVAILQSNYIPWKGYFDLINMVDEFILYDDVQFTKNDWRNRNIIKTLSGLKWLTIPVITKSLSQTIKETTIADARWSKKHWNSVVTYYAKAPHFREYKELFEELYLNCTEQFLSRINYRFLRAICNILEIKTKITWSMDYNLIEGKTERLVDLCQQSGANVYISGPAAKDYIDQRLFNEANIEIQFMNYSDYPEYKQLHGSFEHSVSIIDLILNEGQNANKYMKSF